MGPERQTTVRSFRRLAQDSPVVLQTVTGVGTEMIDGPLPGSASILSASVPAPQRRAGQRYSTVVSRFSG